MTRPVVIEFRADDGSLIRSMRTTGAQADRLSGQLDGTGNSAEKMGRQTTQSAGAMSQLRVAAAATAVVLGARVYAKFADEMATMNARLALATNGQKEFNQAQVDVTRIANDNGRQLGAIAELYTRLAQSTEDYVGKATDTATITQTVTQAMRVSGTSAAESAGAIRQLSQAFASGVLRGDEFNSVNEQAPRIMQALADSLGVTRGELRAMAEQGQLTSDILRTALIDEAGAIAAESAQIPQTLGEAFTGLINNVMLVVGAFDSAAGSSQGFAGIITNVSNRIGGAADWIRERTLSIRLAGIAMVRGVLLAFEELAGGFRFVQGVYTEFFALLGNGFNTLVSTAANAAASFISINASFAAWVPGMGDVAASQKGMAESLRATAAAAEAGIITVAGLGTVWERTRAETEAAKNTVRTITDEMADYEIASHNAAEATGEFTEATEEADAARAASQQRSEEVIDSIDDLARSLAEQAERLREEVVQRAAGTRGLINYRIAKLAAAGATEAEINALEDLRDGLIDQEGALDALNRAQQVAIERAQAHASAMLSVAASAIEAATGIKIFNDENQRGAGAGQSSGGDFSTIGSGVAQSIFNGQSIGDALGSAFTGFGSQKLGKVADKFFEDATTKGIGTAFENSETQDGVAGGFAMAIGQALQGQYGAAIGGAIGTEVAGPIGGMIGQVLGSLIDGLIGEKAVEIQFRGSQGSTGSDRTDRSIDTALGQVDIRFRRIEGQARDQFVNALEEMDASIAASLRGTGLLPQAREAAARFGGDTGDFDNDIEAALRQRLNAIVSTFDAFVADFVNSSESLEGQLENLASVMAVNRSLLAGATLGLPADFVSTVTQPTLPGPVNPGTPGGGDARGGGGGGDFIKQTVATISDSVSGFNAAMQTVGEGVDSATVQTGQLAPELAATVSALLQVRVGNEPLIDTFARTSQILGTLDTASALLGARFGQTRMEAIAFGADLATMFGDDAGKVAAQFNRVFEAFYTEAERAQAQSQMASQEATRLLTSLLAEVDGVEFDAGQLTQAGFRELFESLTSLGTLTAAQTAVLLNAGVAVADYIDAQGTLNDTQQDAADIAQQQADAQALLNRLQQETLDLIAPSWAQYDQLNRAVAENINQARELGGSEQTLAAARRLAHLQQQAFVGELRASIASLNDQLFGTGEDPFSQMASSVQSSASNIGDSIINGLQGVQDWLDSQLLSNLSSLTPEERLGTAQSQFDSAIAAIMAGDFSALGNLPGLANQLLGEGATFFDTSSDQFGELESQVRDAMESIAGLAPPGSGQPPTFAQSANIESATQSTALSALEQAQLGGQLVQQIALLSRLTGKSPSAIGEEFGIPIGQLIQAVTGELPSATGDALSTYFNDLVSGVDDELSALLDISAAQTAAQATRESIDESLRRIAGRPESQAAFYAYQTTMGPQPPGTDSGSTMGPQPPGTDSGSTILPRPDPLISLEQTLSADNLALRDEIRSLRAELVRLGDLTENGNNDRRQLVTETAGVGDDVRGSGDRIVRAINARQTTRRGPGQ